MQNKGPVSVQKMHKSRNVYGEFLLLRDFTECFFFPHNKSRKKDGEYVGKKAEVSGDQSKGQD